MQRVRVAPDRWNFVLEDGTYISPVGGNILNDEHPVAGTLFDHFDKKECDYRFGVMADLGLNCLRQAIGVNRVYHPKKGLIKEGLKNWDTFIGLAEKHGIYLMPVGGYIGGNDWFDKERLSDSGKQLDMDCDFWNRFAGHYKNNPAIWAYDLRNELLYDIPKAEQGSIDATIGKQSGKSSMQSMRSRIDKNLKSGWPQWLKAKYDSVKMMNSIYGSRFMSFDSVPGSVLFEENPWNMRAYDFRCYLNHRGYHWCKRQCEVIRAVAPGHMIVSGNNAWLAPDQDLWLANGFHNFAVQELFDFVTFHPYPACQAVPGGRGDPLDGGKALSYWLAACIGNARIDYYGKPVVLQEFGWYGGGTSKFLCDLPYRSEQEHADYTQTLVNALMPHVNGFINWPTMDQPRANDISNHGGIFTHDGKPKKLAKVYKKLAAAAHKPQKRAPATIELDYSLVGLFTCRKYQDRMWDEIDVVIQKGKIPDFRFL